MKKYLALLSIMWLLLSACSKDKKDNNTNADLEGSWQINSIVGLSEVKFDNKETTYPALNFKIDGTGGATVGCNSIGYKFNASSSSIIVFNEIIATDVYCSPYAQTEAAIIKNLGIATGYRAADGILIFYDSQNNELIKVSKVHAID